jgi:hypothetical protein
MKRNVVLATLAMALLTAVPSWAAPPFGSFGGKVGGGNSGAGTIPLHGWALDDDGIEAVDILVDGTPAGRATYGRARPAVRQQFPGFPNSEAAGFAFQLDTTRYLNGLHTVVARMRSRTGEVRDLAPRRFQFNNITHNLAPFGNIDFPQANAELVGTCDIEDPARRYAVVTGWALDAGIQQDDHGVGYVELMIDRALWANSRRDCVFDAELNGPADCYGLRRLDIARIYPSLRDNPHSGFRFVLDIGALIGLGLYGPGHHTLTIRSGDVFGTVRNIAEIPVTFDCSEALADDLTIGDIDIPRNGLLYSGVVQTTGWAIDFQGISTVTILVDGTPRGLATLGIPRPGIRLNYAGYPDDDFPGWSFLLDTTELSNGQHFLQAIVTDDVGHTALIGERTFVVANPRP